jgi:hypothetical protein
MSAKYGSRDQSGKKKKKGTRTVAIKYITGLSNADIVDKSKFRPKEYGKVEVILRHRGLVWAI